jgi:DnaJ-class molecular chaperone
MRPYDLYALECHDLKTRRPAQIFVEPRVLPDRIFKIENYDLLCEYHMDLLRHKREKRVRLKTPLGEVLLTLKGGIKSGDVQVLPGQGLYMDSSGSARGDLCVLLRHKRDSLFKRLFGGHS